MSSPTEPASKSHFPRSAGEKETSREILIGVPSYHFPLPAAEIITDHKPIQLHGFFSFFLAIVCFEATAELRIDAQQMQASLKIWILQMQRFSKIQKSKDPSETQMQMRRLWNK